MQQVGELPHTGREPRRRPRVVGVPVDRDGRAGQLEAGRSGRRLLDPEIFLAFQAKLTGEKFLVDPSLD